MFSDPFSEEAFLLNSLHEVVKVWARGSGQAKFDLDICDGVAELSLNFKLGHPSDKHCDHPHLAPQPDDHDAPHDDDQGQEAFRPVRPRKSRAQRERNRLRAARHRASTAATAVTAAAATKAAEEAAATTDVILPFTGNIIPMSANEDDPTDPHTAATPSSSTATASPSYAAATAASPKPVRPIKASQTKPTSTLDATFVKKKLFPIPSDHQVPPRNPDGGHKKCYKMKEDDMLTKLFKL